MSGFVVGCQLSPQVDLGEARPQDPKSTLYLQPRLGLAEQPTFLSPRCHLPLREVHFPGPARGLLASCAAVADKHGGEMSRWGWGRIVLLDLSPVRAPSPLDPGPLPLGHGDSAIASVCPGVLVTFGHLDVLTY